MKGRTPPGASPPTGSPSSCWSTGFPARDGRTAPGSAAGHAARDAADPVAGEGLQDRSRQAGRSRLFRGRAPRSRPRRVPRRTNLFARRCGRRIIGEAGLRRTALPRGDPGRSGRHEPVRGQAPRPLAHASLARKPLAFAAREQGHAAVLPRPCDGRSAGSARQHVSLGRSRAKGGRGGRKPCLRRGRPRVRAQPVARPSGSRWPELFSLFLRRHGG